MLHEIRLPSHSCDAAAKHVARSTSKYLSAYWWWTCPGRNPRMPRGFRGNHLPKTHLLAVALSPHVAAVSRSPLPSRAWPDGHGFLWHAFSRQRHGFTVSVEGEREHSSKSRSKTGLKTKRNLNMFQLERDGHESGGLSGERLDPRSVNLADRANAPASLLLANVGKANCAS